MIKKKQIIKIFAIITALSILNTVVSPTVALALTSGPNSPEFSSFEPVATTDMVDIFSGDFTYNLPVVNIPGPDGGGYALSLSYHSGVSPEEEASWVGYGWTLNPGAINRSKAGYPDDYNASDVTKYNKTKPNWSVSAKVDGKLELFSKDKGAGKNKMTQSEIYKKAQKNSNDNKYKSDDKSYMGEKNFDRLSDRGKSLGALKLSKSVRFNNYKGFFKTYGFGIDVKGYGGLNMQGGSGGISSLKPSVDVLSILGKLVAEKNDNDQNEQKKAHEMDDQKKKTTRKKLRGLISDAKAVKGYMSMNAPSYYSVETYICRGMPFTVGTYRGKVLDRSISVQANVFAPIGIEAGFTGNYNIQVNKAKMNLSAYGFLYNPDNEEHQGFKPIDNSDYHDDVISDYMVERQTGYQRNDKYLSIPFSAPDNFVVTGEQMMGGFSYHYKKQGHYYPNFEFSKQVITKGGLELGVGATFQVGFDFGFGNQTTKLRDWYNPISVSPLSNVSQFEQDNSLKSKGFFRFTNDMGGNVEYSNGNEAAQAGFNTDLWLSPNEATVGLNELTGYSTQRSSYIDFNLINDIKIDLGIRFNKKNTTWNSLSDKYNDLIGEFSITSENGMNYVYGLPVFTRNETNVSIGMDNSLSPTIDNNYILRQRLYADTDILDNTIVTGEKRDNPYAMNYLLTQIVTHDYIDVGDDGPDEHDIGGWTQFHYRQWESTETNPGEWYRYRTPYYGMNYNEGNLADKTDDMGTVMTGEKQVYYLKTIETKSHVAFFVTNKSIPSHYSEFTGEAKNNLVGSGEPRKDSYGAVQYTTDRSGNIIDPAAKNNNLKNAGQSLEKLEKIVVYSKKDFSKPLQTVHFEYTNSLCAGLPNAENGAGKLTLKKVWFENEGIVRGKIAPYQFDYRYPSNYSNNIASKYPGINEFLTSFNGTDETSPPVGDVNQNPPYTPYALDMWGNYQANGDTRHENHIPWVYQGEQPVFDAAAWNLKKITLPSGGEIHIQYEQKDYAYVQDKKALVMAPLMQDISSDSYKPDDNKFYLDLNSIGITETDDIKDYVDVLEEYFLADKGELPPHHIYFKFLYSLMGNRTAGFNHCESEYISGFTSVNEVGYDEAENSIYLRLGDGRAMEEVYSNFYSGVNRENTPKRLCYEYVSNNIDGMLKGNNCDCDYSKKNKLENDIQADYEDMIEQEDYGIGNLHAGSLAAESILEVSKHLFDGAPKKNDVCKDINYPFSYLRIPVLKSKKGGGIRVKRLLMYDDGMHDGKAKLYGSEYIYELENGLSSGVATNEPGAGHEENALVQLLQRKSQKFIGRIISGEDKKKMQGPLGESVLPGPSIGYSRVIQQNIHTGKSNTGHTVYEFNTVKKYPLVVKTTGISDVKVKVPIYTSFFNLLLEKYWLTQGFRFVNRNMHGKPHKTSNYSGVYARGNNEDKLVSYTLYDYFDFENEQMPLLRYDDTSKQFSITKENPGKEEKVTMEMRAVTDRLLDIELELDINILFSTVVPTITIGAAPSFVFQDKSISSHITSKVVSYPAVTKKITNFVDGGITSTEHVAFNPANGKPIVTKTFDSYHDVTLVKSNRGDDKHDGSINNVTIPADMIYPELGPKSENMSYANRLSEQAMSFTTYGKGHWFDSIIHSANSEWNADAISTNAVISASATTYRNNWFTGDNVSILHEYGVDLDQQATLNEVWRPQATYIFNAGNVTSANNPENRIYNGGIIEDFTMFDWQATPDPEWLKTATITKYSPQGNPLEEYDVLNIYSAARYGYQGYFPVITAKNAAYSSIYFDDFENNTNAVTKANAHSGNKCLDMNQYMGTNLVASSHGLKMNQHLMDEGAMVKVWLCNEDARGYSMENSEAGFQVVINNNVTAPFEKIASTGKWTLYQAYIKDWENMAMLNDNITIGLEYNIAQGEKVFIDDLRFQPYDASATCYVYDVNNYRLITQFDDQHFGVFYQYNAEGKLVRRMIETERGLKTLKETQYNTKRIERASE